MPAWRPAPARTGRFPRPMTRTETTLRQRFSIDRELGSGRHGRVYLARDTVEGRFVALRVLPPELAQVVGVARLATIMEKAAAIRHPGMAAPLAWGEGPDGLFVAYPYVAAETLQARLGEVSPPAGQGGRPDRRPRWPVPWRRPTRPGLAHGCPSPWNVALQGPARS